jgi:prophage regulatory protein
MNKQFRGQYFRVDQAAEYLSMGRSTIWARSKNDPEFPKPFHIGPRTTVWAKDQLDAYAQKKMLAARGA